MVYFAIHVPLPVPYLSLMIYSSVKSLSRIFPSFDVISNEFIAESKPAMRSIDRDFRIQAKRVFEAARQTGRKVYFHFNGEPCRDIIRKLQEYQRRYGIEMIIDTEVLY